MAAASHALGVQRQPAFERVPLWRLLARDTPLRVFAVTRSKRCGSNEADVRGGSFDPSIATRSRGAWIEKTRLPSSSICTSRRRRRNRSARSGQIQPESSTTASIVSSHLASCTDAPLSARCSATRDRTFAAWPGDPYNAIASFLAFGARQRSWVFCAPRRFVPADGCRAVSGVPGPRVVWSSRVPPD
jgi:hypothetical protein